MVDNESILQEKLGQELVRRVIESMTSGLGAATNTAEFCQSIEATYQYNTIHRGPGVPPAKAVNPVLEAPAQYLTSWRAILLALGMGNNKEDREKVRYFNTTYGGPI